MSGWIDQDVPPREWTMRDIIASSPAPVFLR